MDVAGGSPTFKDSPTGLLKRIEIDTTGTVTFNAPSSDTAQSYGIGAQTLHFSQDGTVLLTSKASNSSAPDLTMYAGGPMFHAVNVTTAARGAGTLMFKEALTMYLRGRIGEEGKNLKNLTISNQDNVNNKIVAVLGHIYADTIQLNTRRLNADGSVAFVEGRLSLGNCSGEFGPLPTDVTSRPPYTVSGNIVTTRDGGGIIFICDYPYHLQGDIGADGFSVGRVAIRNTTATLDGAVYVASIIDLLGAKATFSGDIDSPRVIVDEQSELIVNKPQLRISGLLDMNDFGLVASEDSDGSILALGPNTLTVGGKVRFTQRGAGNKPHTLSLTLGGARSGQLDASTAGVTLDPRLTQLDIKVSVPDPGSIANGQTFSIVKGNASFSASLPKINLSVSPTGIPLTFALSAVGNDLVLTATRARATPPNTVPVAANDRGDLALAPYYTVRNDWVTGLHIVNTSKRTQVVKVRLRRATDAMGALDFNVVMSPQDVYAGLLSDDENGVIAWTSPDTTCTAPVAQGNRLEMPAIYRAGAETGYIEIIAMGAPSNERQPIALAAQHAGASPTAPLDCDAVRSNFFADGAGAGTATSKQGVQDNFTTWQAASSAARIKSGGLNTYVDSGNVLKVSYFIRDNATGIEFGDNAVHIRNFLANPAITNQQYGLLSGDLNGFDFPDLNGGVPLSSDTGASGAVGTDPIQRGRFDKLRANSALGASRILNEWSANLANGVAMNWVVTLPGQYLMLRLPQYLAALTGTGRPAPGVDAAGNLTPGALCPRQAIAARSGGAAAIAECDYRDLPVALAFTAQAREPRSGQVAPAAELVVSPGLPAATPPTYLPKVANVIGFSGGSGANSALGPVDARVSVDPGQPYGWVSASIGSRDADVQVCDWDFKDDISAGFGAAAGRALSVTCSAVTNKGVPVIGFAAWSRRVAANPEASYGRIVEHSYRVTP